MPRTAVIAALVGCLTGSCQQPTADRYNVILVSIDTLRADHVGAYGYDRDTTPSIDRFRGDAILYRHAIAHAPSTLPSHASMLTSLLPSHHETSVAESMGLRSDIITLPEVLKEHGYDTASFNGGIQLDPLYGLSQGFDVYESARPSVAGADLLVDPVDMFEHAVVSAIDWLEASQPEPFFLFLHTYEAHHPYSPDPELLETFAPDYDGALPAEISVALLQSINAGETEIDSADRAYIEAAYDAEIRSIDESFGNLVRYLEERGLYDDTLILVTSDHGEEFGEHGWMGWHSHSLYDELLYVPVIVKLPDSKHGGTEVASQVRGIDLAPTVLSTLGIPVPEPFEGADLITLVAGGDDRDAVSRKDWAWPDNETSLRSGRWKWYSGRLYDLANDPAETTDLAAAEPARVEQLEARLAELRAQRATPEPLRVEPDEELLERLRSLGYIQ